MFSDISANSIGYCLFSSSFKKKIVSCLNLLFDSVIGYRMCIVSVCTEHPKGTHVLHCFAIQHWHFIGKGSCVRPFRQKFVRIFRYWSVGMTHAIFFPIFPITRHEIKVHILLIDNNIIIMFSLWFFFDDTRYFV